jgi:hypothetical protein
MGDDIPPFPGKPFGRRLLTPNSHLISALRPRRRTSTNTCALSAVALRLTLPGALVLREEAAGFRPIAGGPRP